MRSDVEDLLGYSYNEDVETSGLLHSFYVMIASKFGIPSFLT